MQTLETLPSRKELYSQFRTDTEPSAVRQSNSRQEKILDASYEKANLAEVISKHCSHLSIRQQNSLLELLTDFEDLFDGTLGDWRTKPVGFRLKPGAKPFHARRAYGVFFS